MLQLVVAGGGEYYDESTQSFITYPDVTLQLEHSLISLSKWEAKWKKSFLSSPEMSVEELLDYIRCMTINKISDPTVYMRLTEADVLKIRDYIHDPMTATTINRRQKRQSRKIITSEQIYGWMVYFNIPFECEKWHLNRLMTLIEVCGANESPGHKMGPAERAQWMAMQNLQRRSKTGSKG